MTFAMFLIAACTRQAGLRAFLMPKIRVLKPSEQLLKLVGAICPCSACQRAKKREIFNTRVFTLKITQIFNMKRPEPGKAVCFINEPLVKLLMKAEAPQA